MLTLKIIHILASTLWVGGMFMNIFIVSPTAAEVMKGRFQGLEFFALESKRIAPWLYGCAATLVLSGVGLIVLEKPTGGWSWTLIGMKSLCWLMMVGATLYGTLV